MSGPMPSLAVALAEAKVNVKMELISLKIWKLKRLKRDLFPIFIALSLLVQQSELIDNFIDHFWKSQGTDIINGSTKLQAPQQGAQHLGETKMEIVYFRSN